MNRREFLKAGTALVAGIVITPRVMAMGKSQDNLSNYNAKEPAIVNIINFIRAVEPRLEMDLIKPIIEQYRIIHENNLPATWLLQYDALVKPEFEEIFKKMDEGQEIGAWWETPQELIEAAGIKWRGRYSWDWFANVGFLIAYTPLEREKIIDVYMAKFREIWGRYPKAVGSWFIDAHSMAYMTDKYQVVACCNCKDQIGTDGYTLWGGYAGQAYYPSKVNSYCPAQSRQAQINLPIFRMLGTDSIYQYESFMESASRVITLEPVYGIETAGGGSAPKWVRWFFDTNFNTPALAFTYAQVGQENSFGWSRIERGFIDQIGLMKQLIGQGKLRVETLGQSGQWYQSRFKVTPASAVTILKDWKEEGRKTVWYNCKNYRVNLYWEKEKMWLRDIHKFDETYPERYLTKMCNTESCLFDTLPVLDGVQWSDLPVRWLIQPISLENNTPLDGKDPSVTERSRTELDVVWPLIDGGKIKYSFKEDRLEITGPKKGWAMEMSWAKKRKPPITKVSEKTIYYSHNSFRYKLDALVGTLEYSGKKPNILFTPVSGKIVLNFA